MAGLTSCIQCAVLNGQAPPLDSLGSREIPHPYPLQWLSFLTVHTPRPWRLRTLLPVGRTYQCWNINKKYRRYTGAKGAKENFNKAPKLIHTVILCYNFVVQPPPPRGGEPSLRDRPPPPPPNGGKPS